MHWTGRTLVWFVAISWVAALYFSARVVYTRSAWMESVQKDEATLLARKADIVKERKLLAERQSELVREMIGWDHYWTGVPSGQANPKGEFQIQPRDASGAPVILAADQYVYAFAPGENNTINYIGQFKVAAAQQGQSTLTPVFKLRFQDPLAGFPTGLDIVKQDVQGRVKNHNDLADWKLGGAIRIRTLIPSSHIGRMTKGEVDLQIADERLMDMARQYDHQVAMVEAAKLQVARRTAEIIQPTDVDGKDLPPEIKDGLMKTLIAEEEARNAALIQADDLRHRLKATNDRFDAVRKENIELEKTLPKAVATPTTAAK